MNDLIQIGPLNIFVPYLFYIAGIVASLVVAHFLIKRLINYDFPKKPADLMLEYWIVFIVVWKLSYFINYPADLLNNPLAVIYFDGGTLGLLLGVIGIAVFSYVQFKRHNITIPVQLLLILQAIFVFIVFDQATSFLYGFDLYIFIEVVSYIVLISILFRLVKPVTLFKVFQAYRWFVITWALFRVLQNEIHIYTQTLFIVLLLAILTIVAEWYLNQKVKGDHSN
ncbi:hypothetical protein J2R98_000532 [Alkalibacillus filiformis]|uniref:Prolipoprotein diacylglyceryl transferase n=1 Tax=Alkalibacillus filiformis TaxID=200990 RepID=A0ABU0DQM1_9BACI|nr:hypothetical protein [Alkalibacillus filiformis]MDQ0350729.1 hypothetical protein [Alkalibacillus filiformis]